MISSGEKITLYAKPGFGRQEFVRSLIDKSKAEFDGVLEFDLTFTSPLGVFLGLCNRLLTSLGDENMNGAMSRPNTNYMMILNPLFSSLRSKKILFVFYHPEHLHTGNQWMDKNWGQFFMQFMASEFTSCLFITSNSSFQLTSEKFNIQLSVPSEVITSVKAVQRFTNADAKLLFTDELSYNKYLEKLFHSFWQKIDDYTRSKLMFYSSALHVISKRFFDHEDEKTKNVLNDLMVQKIDEYMLDDWLAKLIYGNLTVTERKFIHAEWAKKLAMTPRNAHHPETWALHHHLFYSHQYSDSIDVLNEIVDDQLNMDIDGYLPRVLHDYDEAELSEDLEREIDDIRDLL